MPLFKDQKMPNGNINNLRFVIDIDAIYPFMWFKNIKNDIDLKLALNELKINGLEVNYIM